MDATRKCGPQSGAQEVQILSAGSCAPDLACRRGAAVALRDIRRGVSECWLVACWMRGPCWEFLVLCCSGSAQLCWLFLEGSLFHLFLSWPLFLDRQGEGSQWREGCRTLVCVRCRLRICAGMGSPLFGSGCAAAQLCWRWRFCVSICFAAQLCWEGQEFSDVCAAQRVVVLLRIRAGGLGFAIVRRFGFSFPCRLERR